MLKFDNIKDINYMYFKILHNTDQYIPSST